MAAGWAALVSLETSGAYPPLYKTGGLFFAVWGIYLFDRLFDSFRFPLIDLTPRRHAFAGRNRAVLFSLSAIAMVAAGVFILPHVTRELVEAALFPGALCLLYFIVFRFVKRGLETSFPAKELVIGFCFASGVMVAAGTRFSTLSSFVIEAALATLFAGNCLIIGEAEREFDRRLDAAAFFGKAESGNWIPVALFAFSLALAFITGGYLELPLVGIALALTAVLEWACRRWAGTNWMQPLADGALLFPWILLVFFG